MVVVVVVVVVVAVVVGACFSHCVLVFLSLNYRFQCLSLVDVRSQI